MFWTGTTRHNQTHFRQAVGTKSVVRYIYHNTADLGMLSDNQLHPLVSHRITVIRSSSKACPYGITADWSSPGF